MITGLLAHGPVVTDGAWAESEFLTVPPGLRRVASYDETSIAAEEP